MTVTQLMTLLDLFVLSFLLITAVASIVTRNLVFSTILLGIFSLLMSVQYLILGAPDVAITEAAVGAGISSVLLLLTLSITGEQEHAAQGNFVAPVFVFIIVGVLLGYATLGLPSFGDALSPAQTYLTPYYIEKSFSDIGIPNMVTSILASYRGVDTLGEVCVVFTAAVCVLLLLEKPSKEDEDLS
jgi:multicomponent Na+:H+ antiporter subunit B